MTTFRVNTVCALVLAYWVGTSLSSSLTGDRSANVCGGALKPCSGAGDPVAGVFEDGYCSPRKDGGGTYVVCAFITQAYLKLVMIILTILIGKV